MCLLCVYVCYFAGWSERAEIDDARCERWQSGRWLAANRCRWFVSIQAKHNNCVPHLWEIFGKRFRFRFPFSTGACFLIENSKKNNCSRGILLLTFTFTSTFHFLRMFYLFLKKKFYLFLFIQLEFLFFIYFFWICVCFRNLTKKSLARVKN